MSKKNKSTSSEVLIRTRIAKDILCEVAFPARQSGRVALVCPGVPGFPVRKEVLLFLASQGYVAFGLRYRGTWESEGKFLKDSPAQDVADAIQFLVQKKFITDTWSKEKRELTVRHIDLFGASFGGPAVLLNSQNKHVRKVIALAPVVDMHHCGPEETFEQFVSFSQEGFGGVYRTDNKNAWKKLLQKDFYNPITMLDQIDARKCFIIQCVDDLVCPVENTRCFVGETGAQVYYKPKGGHIGTGKIRHKFYWKKIDAFLKSK